MTDRELLTELIERIQSGKIEAHLIMVKDDRAAIRLWGTGDDRVHMSFVAKPMKDYQEAQPIPPCPVCGVVGCMWLNH